MVVRSSYGHSGLECDDEHERGLNWLYFNYQYQCTVWQRFAQLDVFVVMEARDSVFPVNRGDGRPASGVLKLTRRGTGGFRPAHAAD
jgi:hypothetical protein